MKIPFIMVNYFWGKDVQSNNGMTFGELAKRWKDNAVKYKIPHYQEYIPALNGKYQRGINYKATFLKRMMKKYPTTAILWSDVDMKFQKYPRIFDNAYNADFMAFNWNYDPAVTSNGVVDPYIFETNAEIFYFANNSRIMKFLTLWENALNSKKYGMAADDRILAMVFHKCNMDSKLRCHWLPVEYLYIPQYFSHLNLDKKATIVHDSDLTSEEDAHSKGAAKNRIPNDYNLQRKVRDQKSKLLMSSMYAEEKHVDNRLKKHGFTIVENNFKPQTEKIEHCQWKVFSTAIEILHFWKSNSCPVFLGMIPKKLPSIPDDTDFFCPFFKNKFLKLPKKNFYIYMKKTPTTLHLLHQWMQEKNRSYSALENIFNSNISYFLNLRIN